jgi:predicted Zn finger-like uncharacterized protein
MIGAAFTRGEPPSVFTQCSKCETVFKLSADVLRAAGGQVRCGNCGEVFNALARLAEDANAFAVGGESSYELETRADSILRSPAAPNPAHEPESDEDFGPPGVEIARLQILDWNESDAADGVTEDMAPEDEEPVSDPSMEFTLPPGELDRIFVESKKKQAADATPEPEEFEVDIGPVPTQAKPLPAAPPSSASPQSVPVPAPAPARLSAAPPARALAPAAPMSPPARLKAEQPPANEPAPHPEALAASNSAFDVPDAVRFEILSGIESARPLHELARPARTPGLKRWLTAAVLFALLLAVQMLHHNREYLVTHGPFAGVLRALYARAGAPVSSSANLSAYQLRQWGVSGDPAADGTLRVRASILNSAAQLEPFPLLRVTLANRFGTSIGARDFEPSEYLGKPTARYLNPGEQVDATMDILDPGKSAEGFEIDVCLRGADRKISCANDTTPAQTKR